MEPLVQVSPTPGKTTYMDNKPQFLHVFSVIKLTRISSEAAQWSSGMIVASGHPFGWKSQEM